MVGVYIFIILVLRVFQAFFLKRSSNEVNGTVALIGFNSFKGVISAVFGMLLIVFERSSWKIDWLTVLIATFSGVSMFLTSWLCMLALKSGTLGLMSMFSTAGVIIPIFVGFFLFQEPVTYMQFIGLAIFFVSAYLLIGESKNIYNNFNYKTLLLLIGVLIANGSTMLSQKMFTEFVPYGNVSMFSFLSFAIVSFFSCVYYLFIAKINKSNIKLFSKNFIICGTVLAIVVFLISQLATIATALISPVILFSFICGGDTIISTMVAAVAYKEKITKKAALGIIIGVFSLVLIKLFEY